MNISELQVISNAKLGERVQRPIKILQFGAGNFLRGFTDWMIDTLNKETEFNGDVCVVKPTPRGDYNQLRQQDGLFHVILEGIRDGWFYDELRLVQCIGQIENPFMNWDSYLRSAHNPTIQFIISNTTEAGIRFDVAAQFENKTPSSFPALLTHWLLSRFRYTGQKSEPLVIIPLELITDNGDKLNECVLQYADLWSLEHEFKTWVNEQIFCNTLVDRIVSGFPHNEHQSIVSSLGVEDQMLTKGEYYHSWIIEGPEIVKELLPFDQTDLNVKFVTDAGPYRLTKVRILNGAHTAMVPIGIMNNLETVYDFMNTADLRKFIEDLIYQEIIPSLDLDDEELLEFARAVIERFYNPKLDHYLKDISLNSISKLNERIIPTIKDYVKAHHALPSRSVFAFAAMIRFYKGEWNNKTIPLSDSSEVIDRISGLWRNHEQDLDVFIEKLFGDKMLWQENLNHIPE